MSEILSGFIGIIGAIIGGIITYVGIEKSIKINILTSIVLPIIYIYDEIYDLTKRYINKRLRIDSYYKNRIEFLFKSLDLILITNGGFGIIGKYLKEKERIARFLNLNREIRALYYDITCNKLNQKDTPERLVRLVNEFEDKYFGKNGIRQALQDAIKIEIPLSFTQEE